MGNSIRALALAAGVAWFALSFGQSVAPAGAPAGATGLCKDGSYWTGTTKKGACHGHKGVKDWYGAAGGASGSAEPAAATATAGTSAAAAGGSAGAPAGATGLCKDGTYWTGATKKGACHGHKGVKEWYAAAGGAAGAASPGATTGAGPSTAGAAAAGAGAGSASSRSPSSASTAAAPGGGPGQVWVNTSSKVYHCPADRWYGKTKQGEYMSEAEARAKGFRPDHGKACS